MQFSQKASLAPFLEGDAVIGERKAVGIQALARGAHQDADDLGSEVRHLPQFCLLFTDSVFRSLPILDIGQDAIPLDNVASPVAYGDATLQKPAILPVRAAETYLVLERLAARSAREPLCIDSREIIWMRSSM